MCNSITFAAGLARALWRCTEVVGARQQLLKKALFSSGANGGSQRPHFIARVFGLQSR